MDLHDIENLLPRHSFGLTIEHNEHKSDMRTAREWYQDYVESGLGIVFASDAAMEEAFARDSVWTIQWFPDSPGGSITVAASTLSGAVELASSFQREEDRALGPRRHITAD